MTEKAYKINNSEHDTIFPYWGALNASEDHLIFNNVLLISPTDHIYNFFFDFINDL